MRRFGLIGEHLPHSFSAKYFNSKFEREEIAGCDFQLYELPQIDDVVGLVEGCAELEGFCVTIPYKQQVMPYLTAISQEAQAIGAVNCVKRSGEELIGYNTDVVGFKESLLELLGDERPERALVLGTGGASLAVEYILKELGIEYRVVSRSIGRDRLTYSELTKEVIDESKLIVNATPLGTFPNVDSAPDIPYEQLTAEHFLFDLVYNPAETQFLKLGRAQGAKGCNGEAMLIGQAEAAWRIWNNL